MKNKLTQDDVTSVIEGVRYVIMPDGRTTICELTLTNGFTVRGESSVVSAENFNPGIGREIAHKDAVSNVWRVEGYLLAQRLYEARQT